MLISGFCCSCCDWVFLFGGKNKIPHTNGMKESTPKVEVETTEWDGAEIKMKCHIAKGDT